MARQIVSLQPVEVAAYLKAKGWKRSASFSEDKASLWLAPDGQPELDVLLPRRQSFADYDLRMGDLLRNVAEVEGRSQIEILNDLALVNADVLRLHVRGIDQSDTAVPFDNGINSLRSIRDIFVAAALATEEKRAYFANWSNEAVTEYIERLRLGHTQHSSFVFTVASPLLKPAFEESWDRLPADRDGIIVGTDEPFERKVTHTLMQALTALKSAAEQAKRERTVDVFNGAIREGVSANLCDAIIELASVSPDREIELSMHWAASYPRIRDVPDRVAFREDHIPVIEAASAAFWAMSRDDGTKLEGMIMALEKDKIGSNATALIMAYIDGRAEQIHTTFSADIYREAVRAYEERLMVRCEGNLVWESGRRVLKNARYFEILGKPARLAG